ncbi:Hypothetical predicted protein, partial [Pelobates cultripes]
PLNFRFKLTGISLPRGLLQSKCPLLTQFGTSPAVSVPGTKRSSPAYCRGSGELPSSSAIPTAVFRSRKHTYLLQGPRTVSLIHTTLSQTPGVHSRFTHLSLRTVIYTYLTAPSFVR